jgi:hypothetical protein
LTQNDKNNGETGRRATEVTVDELLQLEQLKLDLIGKRPEGVPKANEELEVTVKVTENLSVNLKCNADVTPVDLLTRLVTEIRELTSQINSTSLQAKLMVPKEIDNNTLKQETDQVSNALNHISTVKELLMKQQVAVPTLKLELSPRPSTATDTGDGKDSKPNTASDSTVAGKDSARGDANTNGERVLPPGSVSSDGLGLTPRKKDLTPRPAEERPSLVAYMNTLLKLNERAAISSEDKKIAKKYKRPKRDKKSNSSSSNKKTSRTMRSSKCRHCFGYCVVFNAIFSTDRRLGPNTTSGTVAPDEQQLLQQSLLDRALILAQREECHTARQAPVTRGRSTVDLDESALEHAA